MKLQLTYVPIRQRKKELLKDCFSMFFILIFVTFIAGFIHRFQQINVISLYLLAVIIIARVTNGQIWGIIASFIAVLTVNYLFTYPYWHFDFTLSGYPITFIIMSITSLLMNLTTVELKINEKIAKEKEKEAQELYSLMKDFVSIQTEEAAISVAISHLEQYLQTQVTFEKLFSLEQLKEKSAKWHYKILETNSNCYGVLSINISKFSGFPREFEPFIDMVISRTIITLEHIKLQEIQQQTLLESEKEIMRSNLLRAVSHDLRTPLTTMLGSTATLRESGEQLDKSEQLNLLNSIHDDCEWLIHMVENLLSVTRIREGDTKLKTTLEPAEEIISSAVVKLKKRCQHTTFRVTIPDELIMVPMDATLIEQVIINLCENAVHHSGCPSPIDISLETKDQKAIFIIRDYGQGIHEEQLPHLFDGYSSYSKNSQDTYKGMGIGLSICKTIVKAHQGTITCYNNEKEQHGGASFVFSLPMEEHIYE